MTKNRAAQQLGKRGGAKNSPAQQAHRKTLHETSPHSGRAALVIDDKREWTRTRIWATRRGWIVQCDSSISGELTGQRYAVDYTANFPAVWPEGMSLLSPWNEGTRYADVLVRRMHEGRCIRRGDVVR